MTNGNGRMLATAVIAILATAAWTLVHMVPFFYVMRAAGLLRVGEEEELLGLDMSHHGGSAYRGASRAGGGNMPLPEQGASAGGKADAPVPSGDLINRIVNLENRNVELERQITSLRVRASEPQAVAVPVVPVGARLAV